MTELTDCELVIMQVLWRNGPMTAQGIEQSLSSRFANSTVRTFLRILEGKGHVAHRKNGRSFVYEALTGHDQAAHGALQLLLERFFEGSSSTFHKWFDELGGNPQEGQSRDTLATHRSGGLPDEVPPERPVAVPVEIPSRPASAPTDQDVWLL